MLTLKVIFDYILAIYLLFLLLPLIVVLFVLSYFSTGEFSFFVQRRVGLNGRIFKIYKIRSMILQKGDVITVENDPRITNFGRFIRKFKLDELPQLINIVLGEMSFVGPRPDVEGYADKLTGEDRIILSVKPGITGPATLVFRNEESVLARQKDPIDYNNNVIWPEKIKINREYIENWTFKKDLLIIFKTIFP